MSIYINKDTKVITQGITGKTGQFHTEKCQEYANGKNCFVAGVNPKKAGESIFNIPIYASVKEAATQTGATVSVIYVPPAGAAAAIWEAVEADLDLAICITEGIPVRDMLEVRNKMKAKEAAGGKRTLLLGPNCPGIITPDEIKIGIMPGHIHKKGRVGVVSRSGTLTYEAVAQLTELGIGQSTAVGIGGDPINGLKHIDVMKAFNDDPETDAVIMIGEIGGPDEAEAALWCKDHMKKPVVGFIAGVTAPAGKRTLLLGPNCPGLITPDEIKIGIMPGHIHKKGRIGVVSSSGTLTYEAVAQLTELGIGQSSAVGIGGDPINGLKHIDVMRAFNEDPDTDAVIMIGEIGGPDEAEAAQWCKANMKKPIVGFIAGVTAPPGKRMGHAGALISGGADTADAKLAIMEECGFHVTRNPSEMGKRLKALL